MTRTDQNFEMWSGNHKDVTVTVTNASSASVSLTGASVWWAIATDANSASLVRLTTDDGIAVSGCTFTVSLSPAHTAGLAGNYYHEAKVRDSASKVSTVTTGNIKINRDVAGE